MADETTTTVNPNPIIIGELHNVIFDNVSDPDNSLFIYQDANGYSRNVKLVQLKDFLFKHYLQTQDNWKATSNTYGTVKIGTTDNSVSQLSNGGVLEILKATIEKPGTVQLSGFKSTDTSDYVGIGEKDGKIYVNNKDINTYPATISEVGGFKIQSTSTPAKLFPVLLDTNSIAYADVPQATTSKLGVVKLSSNTVISNGAGIGINTVGSIMVPAASAGTYGAVKLSNGTSSNGAPVNMDANGMYVPKASYSTYGSVKLSHDKSTAVGGNIGTDNTGKIVSVAAGYGSYGTVKLLNNPANYFIDNNGYFNINSASAAVEGTVKLDGNTICKDTDNKIYVPTASETQAGVIKVNTAGGLSISNSGSLSISTATPNELGTVKLSSTLKPSDDNVIHIGVNNKGQLVGVDGRTVATKNKTGVIKVANDPISSEYNETSSTSNTYYYPSTLDASDHLITRVNVANSTKPGVIGISDEISGEGAPVMLDESNYAYVPVASTSVSGVIRIGTGLSDSIYNSTEGILDINVAGTQINVPGLVIVNKKTNINSNNSTVNSIAVNDKGRLYNMYGTNSTAGVVRGSVEQSLSNNIGSTATLCPNISISNGRIYTIGVNGDDSQTLEAWLASMNANIEGFSAQNIPTIKFISKLIDEKLTAYLSSTGKFKFAITSDSLNGIYKIKYTIYKYDTSINEYTEYKPAISISDEIIKTTGVTATYNVPQQYVDDIVNDNTLSNNSSIYKMIVVIKELQYKSTLNEVTGTKENELYGAVIQRNTSDDNENGLKIRYETGEGTLYYETTDMPLSVGLYYENITGDITLEKYDNASDNKYKYPILNIGIHADSESSDYPIATTDNALFPLHTANNWCKIGSVDSIQKYNTSTLSPAEFDNIRSNWKLTGHANTTFYEAYDNNGAYIGSSDDAPESVRKQSVDISVSSLPNTINIKLSAKQLIRYIYNCYLLKVTNKSPLSVGYGTVISNVNSTHYNASGNNVITFGSTNNGTIY